MSIIMSSYLLSSIPVHFGTIPSFFICIEREKKLKALIEW